MIDPFIIPIFLKYPFYVSVGIMTRADGIAYRVLNTYFSSWYALIMSVLTMNNWSSEKDIISIHELTRLSKTLPYWYALLLSSLVEMGSAADVLATLQRRGDKSATKAKYAVIVGMCVLISLIFHPFFFSKLYCGRNVRGCDCTSGTLCNPHSL